MLPLLASCILLAAACTPQQHSTDRCHDEFGNLPRLTAPPERTQAPAWRPSSVEQVVFGRSVAGRDLAGEIYGSGEQTIFILASIHGNEAVGTPLLRKLGDYFVAHPETLADKRIVLLPIANPDGVAANVRTNLHGVDLNRNFPAWNFSSIIGHGSTALSEPESRAINEIIVKYAPRRIITLHQPFTCIDYDGPAEPLARAMATAARLPLK